MSIWETERRPVWLDWSERGRKWEGSCPRGRQGLDHDGLCISHGRSSAFVLPGMESLGRIYSTAVT